jgi:hypothetical protein
MDAPLRHLGPKEIPLLCAVCGHVFFADVEPIAATGVECPECGAAAGMLPD